MRTSERIDLIQSCARRMQNMKWAEIDLILDLFGFPTATDWSGGAYEYVLQMLRQARVSEHRLADLDSHLGGGGRADVVPADAPWSSGAKFKVFLSHVAAEKEFAGRLKQRLVRYGVEAFVAHEDIHPGEAWQETIQAALRSCDALVALLHTGFNASSWCDQEVGIALGLGVMTVPVKIEQDPYGFIGSIQAVNDTAKDPPAAALAIMELLLADKRTSLAITEAVITRLVRARGWIHANDLARLLTAHPDQVTWEQVDRLRLAQKENIEVGGAFDVGPAIAAIESGLPPRPSPPGLEDEDEDEEPF